MTRPGVMWEVVVWLVWAAAWTVFDFVAGVADRPPHRIFWAVLVVVQVLAVARMLVALDERASRRKEIPE